MNNLDFFQYQLDWIFDSSPLCICEKSRQIGITYAEAFRCIYERLSNKKNYYFSAQDIKSSAVFMSYCKYWLELLLTDELLNICSFSAEKIILPNKSEIVVLSSSPANLRGKTGDITLDEFAWHDDQEALYAAAKPITQWGFSLRIISTHNGINTYFNKLIIDSNNKKNDFKLHRITIDDAIKQGLAVKIACNKNSQFNKFLPDKEKVNKEFKDEKIRNCSSYIFSQEYECNVSSKGTTILTSEIYNKVALEEVLDKLENKDYGSLYVGIDCGRTNDKTVIWILQEVFDKERNIPVYRTICVKTLAEMDIPKQTDILNQLCSHKDIVSIWIDMGSIGRGISDALYNEYGNIVHPIGINNLRKIEGSELIRQYVENEWVSLPKDDTIKKDLLSMEINYTDNGTPKYEAARTSAGHADAFCALYLALLAVKNINKLNIYIN